MIKHLMLTLSAALLGSCSPSLESSQLLAGGSRLGHYKGVDAISSHMRGTFFDPADAAKFNFRLLVDNGSFGGDRLSDLLGSFSSGTGEETMQNDSPNAISALLWSLNLQKFSALLGEVCEHPEAASIKIAIHQLRLHPQYAAVLENVCNLEPEEFAATLEEFWFATMGWGAPDAELEAWQQFTQAEASYFLSLEPKERVKNLLLSIFFNPFYLLES